ncbi:hypothetical protein ACHAWO_001844 [Cyclotella atomus]|uniref:RanBD1 domain-containing protein n=1 Tax=Cyclotella atomus TaxID=382360 RepID=A0ABD3R116_9STRA
MTKTAPPSPEHKPSGCQCDCKCHGKRANESSEDALKLLDKTIDPPTTPVKSKDDASDQLTPPRSDGSHSSRDSAIIKRRRLISFDSNTSEDLEGSATRKLNYESTLSSDVSSEGSIDDSKHGYEYEVARREIAKKLWKANYGDEDDRFIQATGPCKLYEFITYFDAVENEYVATPPWQLSEEASKELERNGKWKCRGTGRVRFIQDLEEGYNCGMIRMEMIQESTLNTMMCHELLQEPVLPMKSKKGTSYTWKCKDWAYRTMKRTFAIRFDDHMEAVKFKNLAEESKVNNCRVRSGLDVPDTKEVDELSNVLKRMCTM